MQMNISCAIEGCTEPVVGQCPGHGIRCGQYYCRTHSSNRLCLECATRRLQDEIQAEYLALAERVRGDAFPISERIRSAIKFGLLFALVVVCLTLAATTLSWSVFRPESGAGEDASLFLLLGPGMGMGLACLSGLVLIVYSTVWVTTQTRKRVESKVAEIDRAKPGFAEFYAAWQAKRQQEMLTLAATIAVGAVVAGVAGAIEDASEKARIRSAVEEGLRRRGY